MKTTRFISLMLFAALFTLLSSCGKEDLSMESAISVQKMTNASQSGSLLNPIVDTAVNIIDPIDGSIGKLNPGVLIEYVEGYTFVESQVIAMSWKNKCNPGLAIIQTEEDYLKVFNGPVSVDLDKYTIITTAFIMNNGYAEFVSHFYFKNDEPTKCRLHLHDIFKGNTTHVLTPTSVAIKIPKMKVTEVEGVGSGNCGAIELAFD